MTIDPLRTAIAEQLPRLQKWGVDGLAKKLEASGLISTGWVGVHDSLPDIDEYVVWMHESGYVIYEAIDKDWDEEYMKYFLKGYGEGAISGPIILWLRLPQPPKDPT